MASQDPCLESKMLNGTVDPAFENVLKLRTDFFVKGLSYDSSYTDNPLDECSVHFLAFHRGHPSGCLTLALDNLPLEQFFKTNHYREAKLRAAEVRYFSVNNFDAETTRIVSDDLLRRVLIFLIDQSVGQVFVGISERHIGKVSLYEQLGFIKIGQYLHPKTGLMTVLLLKVRASFLHKVGMLLASNKILTESDWDIISDLGFSYLTSKETKWHSKKNTIALNKLRKRYDRDSINQKISVLRDLLGINLANIGFFLQDPQTFRNNVENPIGTVQIPLGLAGPLKIEGSNARGEFYIPMATSEGALVLSYHFGMKLANMVGGVKTQTIHNKVHIDPFFIVDKTEEKEALEKFILEQSSTLKFITEATSSHLSLLNIEPVFSSPYYVLKFIYNTQDAQGLNMINHATFEACKFIRHRTNLNFFLRSHYSGIKHFSQLNKETGQGRKVSARIILPQKVLSKLKVSSKTLKVLFDGCIKMGKEAGIPAVNVHAANAIAAIFIACGQDVADLSTSHVCETKGEILETGDGEAFSIETTLFNLMVGTVGGGTRQGTARECLEIMNCYGSGKADQFAEIIAATVVCGEFVTASAIVNENYVKAHNKYGRNKLA